MVKFLTTIIVLLLSVLILIMCAVAMLKCIVKQTTNAVVNQTPLLVVNNAFQHEEYTISASEDERVCRLGPFICEGRVNSSTKIG